VRSLRVRLEPYGFLAPALVSMAVLSLLPILYSVFIAFTNYDLYHFSTYTFVGVQNFVAILTGPYATVFLPTLLWTFIFSAGTTALNFAAGMGLALLLNQQQLRLSGFFRSILIIPWALPSTITVLIWAGLMNQSFGPIDAVLTHLGLPAVPWLVDPVWSKVAILLVNLWLGYPFFMISLLGGLQSVSGDLLEAAALDSAGPWARFRHITFPLLWRFSLPLLMGTFAFNFNNFGVVYLLTGGGPPRLTTSFAGSTDVLSTVIYNMTLTYYRYDIAAAFGIILFIILAVLTLAQYRWLGGLGQIDAV